METKEELQNAIFRMQILKKEGYKVDSLIADLEKKLFELCNAEMDAEKVNEKDNKNR